MASRQGFGELKTEQLGGHSQEQQRHRQAPIDDDDDEVLIYNSFFSSAVCHQTFFEITTPRTVFLRLSQNLAHTRSICQYATNCGTDFLQNFFLTIFEILLLKLLANFFKFHISSGALGQQAFCSLKYETLLDKKRLR